MKKTILPFFLLFAILFSVPAFAVQGKLTADSVSGKVGEQITLRVHLDNPGIIDTRAHEVEAAMKKNGLSVTRKREKNGWVALEAKLG